MKKKSSTVFGFFWWKRDMRYVYSMSVMKKKPSAAFGLFWWLAGW
jgi:hypothetical protein